MKDAIFLFCTLGGTVLIGFEAFVPALIFLGVATIAFLSMQGDA